MFVLQMNNFSIILKCHGFNFQVVVMVPPAIQPTKRVIKSRKGKNITLRCAGKGNPNPRISWSKKVNVCLKC